MSKVIIAAVTMVAGMGALVKSQAPEIQRYLKVKKM